MFGSSVSPISPDQPFFLVVSFGRCKFQLSPTSVSVILQATIGGLAGDFDVLALGDRFFRFSVSSRLVGFHIFKLRSFECSLFKIFFHLWGNGNSFVGKKKLLGRLSIGTYQQRKMCLSGLIIRLQMQ